MTPETTRSQRVPTPVSLPKRSESPQMFDRIARRYDLLNHLLSLRLDFYWRRRAVRMLPGAPNQRVLDLACGTGDLTLAALKRKIPGMSIVGVDLAERMLALFEHKLEQLGLQNRVELIQADALALPLQDESFDATMIAFGIRNMPDTVDSLKEMCRVLRPGGRAIILEFSLPQNSLVRTVYLLYFRYLLPILGRLISGDPVAYRYLNRTVETYEYGDQFLRLMQQAGFRNLTRTPLSLGVVTIYRGEKP
jgi:demethylmenaquinone methyltransferase/2-methoxy-6-polyprenyl-1,4-benzoquinol methylase